MAMRMELEYCRDHNLFPLVLNTDSLAMKNFVEEYWEVPRYLSVKIKRIQELKKGEEVILKHTHRKGIKVVDFIAS